jgi:DtxR family Mn-dependent transcriptional regulator
MKFERRHSPESPENSGKGISGVVPKDVHRERLEDLLRTMVECEHGGRSMSAEHLAGVSGLSLKEVLRVLGWACEAGFVAVVETGEWALTGQGRENGLLVMRAHRLIETRLARESGESPERWHTIAHAGEHRLTHEEINRLADHLGNPCFDPHGDPIPSRDGRWPTEGGRPLLAWQAGCAGVIQHVEDEPPVLFAQLVALGVFAGMRFTLLEMKASMCRLLIEGREVLLSAKLAALIRARQPVCEEDLVPSGARRLSELSIGESAKVLRLLPGCIGPERARLLDLGFVPRSRVSFALQSPFRGPSAFHVRGTLIALRYEQAEQVLIQPIGVV